VAQPAADDSDDGESEIDQLSSTDSCASSPDMCASSPDQIDFDMLPVPERLSSPVTPRTYRLKTYARRDRERARNLAAAQAAEIQLIRAQAEAFRVARKRKAQARMLTLRLRRPTSPTRRSRRTRCGRRGDNTDFGVFLHEHLARAGNSIHLWIE
jgi:hypothetical protein